MKNKKLPSLSLTHVNEMLLLVFLDKVYYVNDESYGSTCGPEGEISKYITTVDECSEVAKALGYDGNVTEGYFMQPYGCQLAFHEGRFKRYLNRIFLSEYSNTGNFYINICSRY